MAFVKPANYHEPDHEPDGDNVVALDGPAVDVDTLLDLIRKKKIHQLSEPRYAAALRYFHDQAGEAWDEIDAVAGKYRKKTPIKRIIAQQGGDQPDTPAEQADERPEPPQSMAHLEFEEDAKARVTAELNEEFVSIKTDTGTRFMRKCRTFDEDPPRFYVSVWDKSSLADWFANKKVSFIRYDAEASGANRFRKITQKKDKIWLEHEDREEYDGIVFDPTLSPEESADRNIYNLWSGWGVDPDPQASCERILNHIYEIWAQRDEGLYAWILDWFADIVQNPKDKPGTALFIVSKEQGTGKSMIFENLLGRILDRAFVELTRIDEMNGGFNAHLQGTLLCYLDDAGNLDNKKHENTLKTGITAPYIVIEEKYKNAYQIRDYKRIAGTLNKKPSLESIVPADEHQRRYTIVEASSARKGDDAYFKALHEEIEQGGAAAFLHHLQNREIGLNEHGVKWIRKPYLTHAVRQQALQNADIVVQVWRQLLDRGGVAQDHEATKLDVEMGWPDQVNLAAFYQYLVLPIANQIVRKTGEKIPSQTDFLHRSWEVFGDRIEKKRPRVGPGKRGPYMLYLAEREVMRGMIETHFGLPDAGWTDDDPAMDTDEDTEQLDDGFDEPPM